jgi:hypothetical protein
MLPARSSGPRYAVGLYRVSTAEQGHSGLGLEAQQASARAFAAAQGWPLVAEYSEIANGKNDLWRAIGLMQGELTIGVAQLRRTDQGAGGDADGMQWPVDLSLPKVEEAGQLREERRTV